MPRTPRVPEETIAEHIRNGLTISQICEREDIGWGTGVQTRFRRIAKKHGLSIASGLGYGNRSVNERKAEDSIREYLKAHGRQHIDVQNGVVLVGSDAHYWPGIVSTAHRAFVKFAKDLRPCAVVMNGDAADFSGISRHPRIGWQGVPSVADELKTVDERLTEIEQAAGTRNLFWPLGNHDARFETHLAAHAPEYENVSGFRLKDRFPLWLACWSLWINENVVVKHSLRNGIHATHNNTVNAGVSTVTSHLHSLRVTPFSDYTGTRFGVDTGMLAAPYGAQFNDYMEDGFCNWRSGFAVLTFWKGRLLWPELVHVIDEEAGLVQFRGQVVEV